MPTKGVVAAGHAATAEAAATILTAGGNAFDAAVAANFAACVAEPVLASMGGGGFLLAQSANKQTRMYDFFVQTPSTGGCKSDLDFYPIDADFGAVKQEFHIGLGSIATPGDIKGMFRIHRDLCDLPIDMLVQPAIKLAREGVLINAFQAYIFDIVSPILTATPAARAIFCDKQTGQPWREGQRMYQHQLANTLEALAVKGEALFYQGEIAQIMDQACRQAGGLIRRQDMESYRVYQRQPLAVRYRDTQVQTNPPPSSGGLLIGFALKLLESIDFSELVSLPGQSLANLAVAMDLSNQARIENKLKHGGNTATALLDPELLERYRTQILDHPACHRGTTHISIMDQKGNTASLTLSNGEGCGQILADTGIMLNNMLGEADLNPLGFHQWPGNQRMTSMMAPTLLQLPQADLALGSGGSNRLRSAILQVIHNLVDMKLPLQQAIDAPRIHFENGHLSIEGGMDTEQIEVLQHYYPDHKRWPAHNLFFGGAHCVMRAKDGFSGAGDKRRGGVAILVE